ncbi:MAG: hypothetical protein IJX26_00460 [Clostridia bacterium]|nr:hypothetical protein [Clostridia bacterium]
MGNIKDFAKNYQANKTNQKSDVDYEKIVNDNPDKAKNLEENLNKYKDLSQQKLMSELFKEAGRLKSEGSLTLENLNNLKSTLAPMLSSEQNEMLNNIINQIK